MKFNAVTMLILITAFSMGCSTSSPDVPQAIFDPLSLPKAITPAEPWLDPLVFFSEKAYLVFASTSTGKVLAAEAAFVGGKSAMTNYLKENIVPHIAKNIGWLKPPVVNFTVNEQGATEGVQMIETCGNKQLDERLLQVISDMPRWTPAQDAEGRSAEQPFEFHVVQQACDQKPPTAPKRKVSMYDVPLADREAALNHPYDLGFSLEKATGNEYTLTTTMKLHGGSFYVSPHSTRDFKGKFSVELANDDHLTLANDFKEIPRSKEEIDPHQFVNGPVNWVNVDTKYEHTFNVTSKADFDLGGKYRFTIEPKCTLEEVPFMIKSRSGVLTMEKWGC